MTDVVERLRSPATVFYEYAVDEGKLYLDAADEIEQLRRALHDIYEVFAGSDGQLYETDHDYLRHLIVSMVNIAAEHKK